MTPDTSWHPGGWATVVYKLVSGFLLQGINWFLLAYHDPRHFLTPRQVGYCVYINCSDFLLQGINWFLVFLLQGIDWFLLADHDPRDFLTPRRVGYSLPRQARVPGVQFRWWQPEHSGEGYDQWALDYVEIIRWCMLLKLFITWGLFRVLCFRRTV